MPGGITVKVCGIRTAEQARGVLNLGVNYVGINGYTPSPRSVPQKVIPEVLLAIPEGSRVYVDVAPAPEYLREIKALGFDALQIHGTIDELRKLAPAYAEAIEPQCLWLAPKLPPGKAFPEELMNYAETFLIDAYSKELHGGTGKTANWETFRNTAKRYKDKRWILAGGLCPENICDALKASQTRFIDLNSGIENTPGIKDMQRLESLLNSLR